MVVILLCYRAVVRLCRQLIVRKIRFRSGCPGSKLFERKKSINQLVALEIISVFSGASGGIALTALIPGYFGPYVFRVCAAQCHSGGSYRTLTQGWARLQMCRWSSRSSSCLACWNSCLSLCIRSWLLGVISLLVETHRGGEMVGLVVLDRESTLIGYQEGNLFSKS